MSSDKGWFESEDDYRDRIAREADERTIEESTGSAPSKGWFESDDDYRDRISREANEHTIEDSTGTSPSKGWLESDDDYRSRISQEANERIVEDSTGSSPSKGWLESDEDYEVRLRKEANEHTIENSSGSSPQKGWLEGDHEYRSRIAHEARQTRAQGRKSIEESNESSSDSDSSPSFTPSGSANSTVKSPASGAGCLIVAIVLGVFGLLIANIGNQSTSSKHTTQQSRPNEAARLAERSRVEKVFSGDWRLTDQDEEHPTRITLSREGNDFHGEYREGERIEPLSGQIQDDNRLLLRNNRQFCKIVQPGSFYVGPFSQQAWLKAGTNSDVLFASFSDGGSPISMIRIGSVAEKEAALHPSPREERAQRLKMANTPTRKIMVVSNEDDEHQGSVTLSDADVSGALWCSRWEDNPGRICFSQIEEVEYLVSRYGTPGTRGYWENVWKINFTSKLTSYGLRISFANRREYDDFSKAFREAYAAWSNRCPEFVILKKVYGQE